VGWSIHRWPANRFDAMDDTLALLRLRGFAPQCIVDIGANVGVWTEMAAREFDAREFHLVEPQHACLAALRRFPPPRFTVHPVALTPDPVTSVYMAGGGAGGGTGAWVVTDGNINEAISYPATSLDALLADRITAMDRPLVKLDVETYELDVLRSGPRVLTAAEVVIMEFFMFQIEGNGRPVLTDQIAFMMEHGFRLYDFAQLAARRRDQRLRMGDVVFVRADSPLLADNRWA
jgi:FkbM family methyltransferase